MSADTDIGILCKGEALETVEKLLTHFAKVATYCPQVVPDPQVRDYLEAVAVLVKIQRTLRTS